MGFKGLAEGSCYLTKNGRFFQKYLALRGKAFFPKYMGEDFHPFSKVNLIFILDGGLDIGPKK